MPKKRNFDEPVAEEQLREPITDENCGEKLRLVQKAAKISRRELAKVIGVSEGTLRRLESGHTKPTDEFMTRLRALCVIGVARFAKMSDKERDQAAQLIGIGGGAAGIGAAAAGVVGGFSAAGITSGLAAIGGGAMLAGLGVVAAIPVATGLAGYGLVKGIKAICEANDLETEEVNEHWEIRNRRPASRGEEPKE